MKIFYKTAIVAACLMLSNAANAQFGGMASMLGGGASASGDIATEVASFMTKTSVLSELTTRSVTSINAAFSTDEEIAAKRAALQAIEQITDPKERGKKMAVMYESEVAEGNRKLSSGEMEKKMGGLDAEKKKQVGGALLNFGIGALQAVDLTRVGQGIVQKTASNPMNISKVIPVKDALPILGKVAGDAGGFVAGVMKLAKGANISVQAVKVDSKPVDVPF